MRDQPDQPGRAGERDAYPSEVDTKSLASRDSIGRERGKGGLRGSTDEAAEAPTRMVVAPSRLPVAMAAASMLPKVVPQ